MVVVFPMTNGSRRVRGMLSDGVSMMDSSQGENWGDSTPENERYLLSRLTVGTSLQLGGRGWKIDESSYLLLGTKRLINAESTELRVAALRDLK